MCAHRTPDEIKQHCVDLMGERLGCFYHALSNELAWLYIKWGEYVNLFGTKPSRIDLLNNAAGGFFRVVQDALWDDVLLHITRLTDLPKWRVRRNLTIRALPNLIDKPEIRQSVQVKIDVSVESTKFARDWRNRQIAHKDLALALEDGAEPLMLASRAKFKEALNAITDVTNEVSRAYIGSIMVYDSLENAAGAISLLHVLDDGLRVEQERKDRFKLREYREDDYKPRDL